MPGLGIWAQIPILIPEMVEYSGMSTTGVLNPGWAVCSIEFQWISVLGAGWGMGPLVFLGLEFVLVI